MPSPTKYPLEPLLAHRERLVEDAEAAMARAIAAREAEERAETTAIEVRTKARDAASAVRAEESARIARGEARAVDLARVEAWERSEAGRQLELDRRVEDCGSRVRAAREGEARARAELAAKMADRDVVAKDEVKFDDARKRAAEAREEEDAAEAFGGRSR